MLEVDVAPRHATAVVEQLRELIGQVPEHPSLVPITDAGITNGRAFIVTPPVTGESLDSALAAYGPAAFGDALPRLQQLADALDRAAACGWWHGRLTPQCILVGAEDTHLLDVGVAQALRAAAVRVRPEPPYAAPEVLDGDAESPAGDQYSLAVVAHEWLFGQVIGPAEDGVVLRDLPGVDAEALSRTFAAALSPRRETRFASCTAFVDALGQATRIEPESAAPGAIEVVHHAQFTRPVIELGEPVDERTPDVVPMAFAALEPPSVTGFSATAVAAALIAGIAIGATAMWMWMPTDELVVAEAGTQEFTDEPLDPTAPPQPQTNGARDQPATRANEDVAPAARSSTASLLVRSTPANASVSINGVPRGVTPLPLRDLEFGDHTVVVSRAGYVAAERRLTLTSDRPSRSIELSLAPATAARSAPPNRPAAAATAASLVIESRPAGATVVVDDRRVGVTPLTIAAMTPGRHTVRLERTGYRPWTTTVDIEAGARARVAASLVGGQQEE